MESFPETSNPAEVQHFTQDIYWGLQSEAVADDDAPPPHPLSAICKNAVAFPGNDVEINQILRKDVMKL